MYSNYSALQVCENIRDNSVTDICENIRDTSVTDNGQVLVPVK